MDLIKGSRPLYSISRMKFIALRFLNCARLRALCSGRSCNGKTRVSERICQTVHATLATSPVLEIWLIKSGYRASRTRRDFSSTLRALAATNVGDRIWVGAHGHACAARGRLSSVHAFPLNKRIT